MYRSVFIASVFALVCLVPTAIAKPGPWSSCEPTGDVMRPCAYRPNFLAGVKSIKVRLHKHRAKISHPVRDTVATIVPHPIGCPSRSFCGCGAAVRIFGKPVRDLWLAANWFRFPRSAPSAGMVAVRRHHVFVLEAHLGGDRWLAYDANSGGHRTRVHARSIAGFVIVNPRAG